jgi:hypothetical protein
MIIQRRFAPIGGRFEPEQVAGLAGIYTIAGQRVSGATGPIPAPASERDYALAVVSRGPPVFVASTSNLHIVDTKDSIWLYRIRRLSCEKASHNLESPR